VCVGATVGDANGDSDGVAVGAVVGACVGDMVGDVVAVVVCVVVCVVVNVVVSVVASPLACVVQSPDTAPTLATALCELALLRWHSLLRNVNAMHSLCDSHLDAQSSAPVDDTTVRSTPTSSTCSSKTQQRFFVMCKRTGP
jgi:hypothetical protein